MKVQHITDIDGFVEVVRDCKGKVELVTGEGDRLNLKSKRVGSRPVTMRFMVTPWMNGWTANRK